MDFFCIMKVMCKGRVDKRVFYSIDQLHFFPLIGAYYYMLDTYKTNQN